MYRSQNPFHLRIKTHSIFWFLSFHLKIIRIRPFPDSIFNKRQCTVVVMESIVL
ncbi:hypothetical protein Hanom_Chr11g01004661 [Helianthus anomalus]